MSDIQLRVQTTFDVDKNDLQTKLKQLQKDSNVKLDFDVSSINSVISSFKDISNATKSLSTTLNDMTSAFDKISKSTNEWSKQIDNVKTKQKYATDETNKQEQAIKRVTKAQQELTKSKELTPKQKSAQEYYNNLIGYVQKYKIGLMDLGEYVSKLQEVMYKKDGNYAGQFMNMDYSKQVEVVNELTNALKTQQKVREETAKIKQTIDKDKENEKLQQQTKLYERLLQLQQEEFNLQNQLFDNGGKHGALEKELQLQLQINKPKQEDVSKNIKDNNLVN